MPRRSRFTYDPKTARYRNARGQFVDRAKIRRELDKALKSAESRVRSLAESYRADRLSLAQWEQRMRAAVRDIHSYSAMVAAGGRDRMGQEQWLTVGRELKRQYSFIRRFADELAAGAEMQMGRVRLYAQAGRTSYHEAERAEMQRIGLTRERNVLSDSEHCRGCISETERGWVPIGELRPIGSRDCLTNDRCTISYE